MKKSLITIGFASVLFIILIYSEPIWSRTPGGLWVPLIFLSIFILFFWLIIKLIREIIGLIKNRKNFEWIHLLPIVLICGFFGFMFLNTLSFDVEDRIYGKVIFRACYEGTQNQATFKLRDGNRFELHWTGVFFYDEFYTGTYRQVGDTLILNYKKNQPIRFGNKILMENEKEMLTTIRQDNDGLENVVPFYYGYCKGLN